MKKLPFLFLTALLFFTHCTKKTEPKRVDFEFPNLSGNPVKLSDYRGKIVLADVWATWNTPSLKQIPYFIRIQEKFKDRGVDVIGISVDEGGTQTVQPMIKKMGMTYTQLVATIEEVERVFGDVQGLPVTFLIDRKGFVRKKFTGLNLESNYIKEINRLLESEEN